MKHFKLDPSPKSDRWLPSPDRPSENTSTTGPDGRVVTLVPPWAWHARAVAIVVLSTVLFLLGLIDGSPLLMIVAVSGLVVCLITR